MKLAIVGSRIWKDAWTIRHAVQMHESIQRSRGQELIIVSGGAIGPDSIAVEEAKRLGLQTEVFDPQAPPRASRKVYTAALFARNRQIAEAADEIWGFVARASPTHGTDYTLDYARTLGKRVVRIDDGVYGTCQSCGKELQWVEFENGLLGPFAHCYAHYEEMMAPMVAAQAAGEGGDITDDIDDPEV